MTPIDELRTFMTSALASDAMDALALPNRCLGASVTPLHEGTLMIGRCYTVSCVAVDARPEVPYVGLLRALDGLGKDDVYAISSAGDLEVALWGELLTNAALQKAAAGVLADGPVRDARRVRELGLPVFSRGTVPYDINGRLEITGTGEPLVMHGLTLRRGDLVIGDDDGIAIVPIEVEQQVIALVREKVEGENLFREAVRSGMPPSEAFARFGVL